MNASKNALSKPIKPARTNNKQGKGKQQQKERERETITAEEEGERWRGRMVYQTFNICVFN